ncbi:MAG: DUF1569 domain-containing protein [Burkholderiales bacterium]|uniref:DUF1569 domain-containing protein n=1 Tax=Inhella sp. TaxID=1921806 RepID=UPI001AC8BBF6|nr:DUF1569 domain-containing protein [Burkholderiales bacterium]
MDRRHFVLTGAAASITTLSGCEGQMASFTTLKEARQRVLDLRFVTPEHSSAWSLPQMLQHLAQSIEYSMVGFPEMKSAAFRAVVGKLAFAVFNARGEMSHSLTEPIPGAPALDAQQTLATAVQRLLDALAAFEAWDGPLKPHFAYGELDKAQYTRAHLMHLANHWTLLRFPPKKS